ncbi:hypothetical protein F5146DRAFT_1139459 [Armillaria mellea]|nr:hypothetical protein F5146DRAFT_1139459 [Armillaria mellea]
MTPISMELLPNTGTKINLTMCPGPFLIYMIGIGKDSYYITCAWNNPEIVPQGLNVIGNSSSTSRTVMVNDITVLVPTNMPDNVDSLIFNSFGLVTQCQPMLDCLFSEEDVFYCPFNPLYNASWSDLLQSGSGWIEMLNLTGFSPSMAVWNGAYHLDAAWFPYGAHLTLYWSDIHASGTVFPFDTPPGWCEMNHHAFHAYMSTCHMITYNVSLSYSTVDGNNMYNFTDCPIQSNFNTTSILFAGLDPIYGMNLVEYLKTTLVTSVNLFTETFNAVLSRNMSYAAMSLALPLFKCNMSTGGNTILPRSASRYPLAPLIAVLAILYTYAFLALAITMSSMMLSSWEIMVTKNCRKEHRATAIELIQLCLMNPLASIAERFVDLAWPELLLEPSAVDMFHEHLHADKLGVIMMDGMGGDREGIVRRR